MDRFVKKRPAFAPPKKKAGVSIADMMRANPKKAPLGENQGDASVMGGLGAASLARVAGKLRKKEEAPSTLTEEQRQVVECARDGRSVFFTGNAALPRVSASAELRHHALPAARCSPRGRARLRSESHAAAAPKGRPGARAIPPAAPPNIHAAEPSPIRRARARATRSRRRSRPCGRGARARSS